MTDVLHTGPVSDAIDTPSSLIDKDANGEPTGNASSLDSTLPNETLCLIFETAHALANADGALQHPLVEVTISHVCKRWRDIAISFPNIWTNFRFKTPNDPHVAKEKLAAYLERSGVHPIDLFFHFGDHGEENAVDYLPLLESTIPHADRWRRVTFFSDENIPIIGLVPKLRSLTAPQLEYFTMRPDMYPLEEFEDVGPLAVNTLLTQVFSGGAPKLSHVWLDASSSPRSLPPLSNVTTLRLEDRFRAPGAFMSWMTLLDILALPYLTSLSIFGQHFLPPDLSEDTPITMNSLKHLRYGGDDESLPYFLPFLKAPLLETLVLNEVNTMLLPYGFPPAHPFTGVRKLIIFNCEFPEPSALPWIVSMTPNVTDLTVSHNGGQQLLDVIHRNFKDQVLWRQIETVACNLFNCDGIECYLAFADYCTQLGKRLKKLKVSSRLLQEWRGTQSWSENLKEMQQLCDSVEELPDGSQLFAPWPPGAFIPHEIEDDVFIQSVY